MAEGHAAGLLLAREPGGEAVHLHRAVERALRVIGLLHRGGEHDGQRVAHDAVQRALVAKGDGAHLFEVAVEQLHRIGRVDRLHQRGEARQVGEDETALLPFAAELQLLGVLHEVRHAVGRNVARERLPHPAVLQLAAEMPAHAGQAVGQGPGDGGGEGVQQHPVG